MPTFGPCGDEKLCFRRSKIDHFKEKPRKALFCHMWSIKGYAFNGRSDPLFPFFGTFMSENLIKPGASAYCNQKER